MQLIGWTLIHSLWEGGVIALLLAIAFSAARNSAASVRYALGMAGLALMVALPIATAARMSPRREAPKNAVAAPVTSAGLSSRSDAASPFTDVSGSFTTTSGEPVATPSAVVDTRASILSSLEPSLPWLVAAWLTGLLLLSARMIGGVARTRRIVRDGRSPASDRVLLLVSRLSEQLGVRRAVRALEGTHVTVPMVIGWLRPVIVVPGSLVTGLTPWQLEMLLAHELAHIRRYDFLANMLQTVVETLLFFHPAAWWLSDRIREERENCCDDIAVAACGGDRRGYTTALLALEETRDNDFAFAAAATGSGGGTLLRRAMRLMSGGPAHVDLGARWIAGVITILAALFATGPAVGRAADLSIASRLEVLGFLAPESDTVPRNPQGIPDPARSNPDTVLRYAGDGSFAARWTWAEQRARSLRSSKYWVGYLVAGDPTGRNMIYSDRETPVRSGKSTFIGSMRIGDARSLEFSGAALSQLVGNHAPTSIAIFLQFDRAGSNERLARVHVGSFRFPVYFDDAPAIWLDSATDAESVAKLRALVPGQRSLDVRRDLISAVGAHRDANVVLPALIEWIDSRAEPDVIRREAVDALGGFPDGRAVAALARVARNDRSTSVRKEAIEAFEGIKLGAAADTLIAFATSLESSDLRRVAIESLGGRHEPRVVAFLTKVALGDDDTRLRMDAIEALGSMHEEGFAAISELARHAPDADVRRTAVEELSNSQPADRALGLLGQIIRSDADEELRRAAIEALGNVHGKAALDALRAVAQGTDPEHLRRQAMETYADNADTETAVTFLRSIAADDPSGRIRLNALEILSELDNDVGIPAIRELARSSSDPRVRKQALEILSER